MRPDVGRGRWVAAWPGMACLGLLPLSPLSAHEPKVRITLEGHTENVRSVAYSQAKLVARRPTGESRSLFWLGWKSCLVDDSTVPRRSCWLGMRRDFHTKLDR